jgi:hypothetical protein
MCFLCGVREPIRACVHDTRVVRSGPQRETRALCRFAKPKIKPVRLTLAPIAIAYDLAHCIALRA